MDEKERREAIVAFTQLGSFAAAVYAGALQESGSTAIARAVTQEYVRATINQETPKFFI